MSLAADSFKPPCLLGYYPCISNPSSKDCTIIDTCSKDVYFCKFAKLQFPDGTDISCRRYSFSNWHCTHGGGSCPGRGALERRRFGGSPQYMQMPEKVKRIDKKVDRLEIKFERLIEALGQVDNFEADRKRMAEGQRKLGEYTV